MAKFLTGNELNAQLSKLLERAEEQIILISPFIKLHNRYASILQTKNDNPKLQITIVFGKNEDNISKSMKQEDFLFFKEFPNVEIRYEKRLHAKYYASESAAILTSMNLYDYSQDNNIEAGVMTKATLLGNLAGNLLSDETFDHSAWAYFARVIEQSELLFKRSPEFENAMLGLSKKYVSSNTETDRLSDFFNANYTKKTSKKTTSIQDKNKGYCIRTGVEISFNIEKPFCQNAFKSWSKYSDPDYSEKYCHFSGEPSNGKTSMKRPILSKHWKKAKEMYNFK